MAAYALQASVAEYSAKLGAFEFCDSGEIFVTEWRAKLYTLEPGRRQLLNRPGKVLSNHGSDRIGLASDWKSERVGVKFQGSLS
jgi:hypothetical protein